MFVAIQVGADVTTCLRKTAIDGVVHTGVPLHKQLHAVLRIIGGGVTLEEFVDALGSGILDDVLGYDCFLIRDRSDSQP